MLADNEMVVYIAMRDRDVNKLRPAMMGGAVLVHPENYTQVHKEPPEKPATDFHIYALVVEQDMVVPKAGKSRADPEMWMLSKGEGPRDRNKIVKGRLYPIDTPFTAGENFEAKENLRKVTEKFEMAEEALAVLKGQLSESQAKEAKAVDTLQAQGDEFLQKIHDLEGEKGRLLVEAERNAAATIAELQADITQKASEIADLQVQLHHAKEQIEEFKNQLARQPTDGE